MGEIRTRGCAGRNTSNSVPGGIFAKSPEVDGQRMLAYKQALDGHAAGRFNSSGVAGGIFAPDGGAAAKGVQAAQARHVVPDRSARTQSPVASGPVPHRSDGSVRHQGRRTTPSAPRDVGPILGGGGVQTRWGDGAERGAGGRSSNARPDGVGHTRGNLRGAQTQPLLEKAAGSRTVEGAFAKFLQRGPKALTQPYAVETPAAPPSDEADFLERVSLAEQRDNDDAILLEQLNELEAQSELIRAAAAQIAAEEQLDPAQEEMLAQRMVAHISEQAQRLRAQMASPRREGIGAARQARQQRPSPAANSTLSGILSPEPPGAGGAAADGPHNPIKGRGMCNPNVDFMPNSHEATGGIQYFPHMGGNYDKFKDLGAAGEPSPQNWRSTINYMAHGAEGYGDFRSEHLALQMNTSPQANRAPGPQSGGPGGKPPGQRHMQTESKVVFGGNPGGLYPGSPSMIRGKYPGY
jgi:hypothetical protein